MSMVLADERPVKRKYSDVEKADALVVLDLNAGNIFKTAKELGIPRKTLESWATERAGSNWSVAEMRHESKLGMAEEFESTARKYLNHAQDPYVIAASSGRDAVFAAALAIDKTQLLRNLPTQITANIDREDITVYLQSSLDNLD